MAVPDRDEKEEKNGAQFFFFVCVGPMVIPKFGVLERISRGCKFCFSFFFTLVFGFRYSTQQDPGVCHHACSAPSYYGAFSIVVYEFLFTCI